MLILYCFCVHLLVYYLLTYSMVQSPSWEANWFAASQEIPHIFMEPEGFIKKKINIFYAVSVTVYKKVVSQNVCRQYSCWGFMYYVAFINSICFHLRKFLEINFVDWLLWFRLCVHWMMIKLAILGFLFANLECVLVIY